MILDPGQSQINETSYLPLIAVKNGLKTTLTTDGIIDLNNVSQLNLPPARYDYVIRVTVFNNDGSGVVHCTGTDFIYVRKGQNKVDINRNVLAKLDAELFEKEI